MLSEIRVALAGGRFTLHACPSCEDRWWDRDGERVALDRVLSSATSR
jgi:hypothetical protein